MIGVTACESTSETIIKYEYICSGIVVSPTLNDIDVMSDALVADILLNNSSVEVCNDQTQAWKSETTSEPHTDP